MRRAHLLFAPALLATLGAFAGPGPADSAANTAGPGQGPGQSIDNSIVRRAIEALMMADTDSPVALPDLFFGTDVLSGRDGSAVVRLARRYKGLDVIGGDVVVQMDGQGKLQQIVRTAARRLDIDLKPQVSQRQAELMAMSKFAGIPSGPLQTRLVILARDGAELAWDVTVAGRTLQGRPREQRYFIGAQSSRLLDGWDDLQTTTGDSGGGIGPDGGQPPSHEPPAHARAPELGTGFGLHAGAVALTTQRGRDGRFELVDPTRGTNKVTDMRNRPFNGGRTLQDSDNQWATAGPADPAAAAVDAAYGMAMTWDYYLHSFGRRGIGNDGAGVISRVHWWQGLANAGWSSSCNCVKFGDGDGTERLAFTALDVTGHEVTHGLVARTAGLLFSRESGALNEATADIFGTMIEFFADNPSDPPDYLIGEKTFADGRSALRYMYRPSLDLVAADAALDERSPAKRQSADCWFPGLAKMDVHFSSGVANHFFYLLAEGSHPADGPVSPTCRPGDARVASGSAVLAGIGRDAAASIWYRALTAHMTSDTRYGGARRATVMAAGELFGAQSREAAAVKAAWSAVNVD